MYEHDSNAEELKQSLYRNGVWHQDSFTFIAAAMYACRPSLCLHHHVQYRTHSLSNMENYENLIDIACEYADAMSYPWIKTKLKDIVWVDFRGFYNTLTQLIHEGKKNLPFDNIVSSLINDLAAIWMKIGIFPDDYHVASTVINGEAITKSIMVQ